MYLSASSIEQFAQFQKRGTAMKKWFNGKVLFAAMVICGSVIATLAAARPLSDIKSDGVIKIGVEGVFVPFSYRENGKLVGYDVDLANVLFNDLGVKVEFVDT